MTMFFWKCFVANNETIFDSAVSAAELHLRISSVVIPRRTKVRLTEMEGINNLLIIR